MSDVQSQELSQQWPDKVDVRLLSRGRLRQRHHAGLRELGLDWDRRIDERNSFSVQFLRDGTNLRDDDYGGSPDNRTRLLAEITAAVVREAGADRTSVRLSPLWERGEFCSKRSLFEIR